jgi:hypothetical protein
MDELLEIARYLVLDFPQRSDRELAANVREYFDNPGKQCVIYCPIDELDSYEEFIVELRTLYRKEAGHSTLVA